MPRKAVLRILTLGVVLVAAWYFRSRQQLATRRHEGSSHIATENDSRWADRGVSPPRFVERPRTQPRGTDEPSASSKVTRVLNGAAWVRVPPEDERNRRLNRHYERKEAAALGALSGLDLTPQQLQQVTDLIRSSLAKAKAARQRLAGAGPPATLTDFLSEGEAAISIETECNKNIKSIIGPERMQRFMMARNELFRRSYDGQNPGLR
jgi:hypothetical protein